MAGMFGETGGANTAVSNAAFKQQLNKVYAWYTGGFIAFVIALAILEQEDIDLVISDWRMPGMDGPAAARAMQTAARPGLLAALAGAATLDEAIHEEPDTGLHLLMPLDNDPPGTVNAADLLASDRFRDLIRALSARYDLVVLDTPPTLVVADARILCPAADAVVYVVRWDHTPRGAVAEGLRELAAVGAPLRGVALTMVNEVRAARYPVDGYVYYRGRYRDYYGA